MKLAIILLLATFLSTLIRTNFIAAIPDALICGVIGSDGEGAIYFAHAIKYISETNNQLYYCQIHQGEGRCVLFKNGNYQSSWGHAGSVNGCKDKTIWQLKVEGRAFNFALSMK